MITRALVLAVLAVGLAACDRRASVEGDVYAAGGGLVLKGAGDTVHFLREPDSARVAMTEVCEHYATERGPLHAPIDSATPDYRRSDGLERMHLARLEERIRRLPLNSALEHQIIDMAKGEAATKADVNGHYRVDGLAAGRYLVLAVDPGNMFWVDTITVSEGARAKHDLTDMKIGEGVCAFPLVDPEGRGRFNGAI